MARTRWQEFVKCFPLMEARFVGCEIRLPRQDGSFTVALHAWDEANTSEDEAEVTFHAKTVRQVKLSRNLDYEPLELDFTQEHPLLWDYEQEGSIVCLSPLTLEQWRIIVTQAQAALTGDNREVNVAECAARQVEQFGRTGSFALGKFPLPLHRVLLPILDAHGLRCFLPYAPEPVSLPVLFLIDGDDYIIADDFEIDLLETMYTSQEET